MVRLEGLKELAGKFVLVRLGNIDSLDLNLFTFDYDLTFAVFFLSAEEKVYARYGGRDAKSADGRQSLKGLAYTMRSVLEMHRGAAPAFAPRDEAKAVTIRDIGNRGRRCYHCHNVQEAINAKTKRDGEWGRDRAFRFPLPDVLGLGLEVDRGNVVRQVEPGSAADTAGLRKGGVVKRLGGVPIHSQADAQFALDRAPAKGPLAATWQRDGKEQSGELALKAGWRQDGDLSWRPSLRRSLASLPVYGAALTADEKKKLGLAPGDLAIRQREAVHSRARALGVQAGDVIVGIDDRKFTADDAGFRKFVSGHYLKGDSAKRHVLRDGKRVSLAVTFR